MKPREWLPEEDALLATKSDSEVSKLLNTTPLTVKKRREKLGIPPAPDERQRRSLIDDQLQAKLDELTPFLIEEFRKRGVPVRDINNQMAIEFLVDQALVAFKREKARGLYKS